MKIIAVSDSHGNRPLLREAVLQAMQGAPIDVFVHCGDGARDLDAVEPILRDVNPNVRIYSVRGNCDIGAFDIPQTELFEVNGARVFATHGHLYGVKTEYESLTCAAHSQGAQIAFFGHTHRPFLEAVRGIYLMNPGAVCAQLAGNVAYAQALVDAQGHIHADLMRWLR